MTLQAVHFVLIHEYVHIYFIDGVKSILCTCVRKFIGVFKMYAFKDTK
jgi:hypothetical protein